jgi:soluble lytic murein transglycosylase-like protein
MAMLGSYGWSSGQFGCLNDLWTRESGWNPTAENTDGAFGIPQALPGSKMASAGADWQANPATQIRWGLGYIKELYGSPCGAWDHELATGSY